jgi:hypothetical protein
MKLNSCYLTQKFLKILDTNVVTLVTKLPGPYAGKVIRTAIILIDHRKDDALSSFVHELLHIAYPKKSEYKILVLERRFMKCASWKQKKVLLKRLM